MTMKRFLSLIATVALSALTLNAQSTIFGGEVISPPNMSHMEAAKYAQTEHTFLTSRVAAMGGAFTALGADLSSMSINPAGLGMYRGSALSLSMAYDHTRSTNGTAARGVGKGDFSFNQIGTALNLYQSSGTLASVTLAFGYNRVADLNFRNSAMWGGGEVTIGEFFAEQMYGFNPSALNSSADPFRNSNIYTDEWGGVLAYQTYFIDPALDQNQTFLNNYYVTGVPLENKVNSLLNVESNGSVGEYDFSMGFNFANFLYLGATIAVQDIQQEIYYSYEESYTGATGADELSYTRYTPMVASYGSGVNFKLGAIVRPISALRLGIAYHTPTFVGLTRDYRTYMQTEFANGDAYGANSLTSSYTYSYNSPAKLLLGASLSLGNKAIISVDYDKVWYGNMTMENRDMEEAFAADVANDLGTAENYRAGLEIRPIEQLYLRAGYAYYGTPFNKQTDRYNDDGYPFYGTYKSHSNNFSLGAGWRFASGSSLDFVWTLSRAHYTNSVMYYYSYVDADTSITVAGPTMPNTVHSTNNFGLTYSVRF